MKTEAIDNSSHSSQVIVYSMWFIIDVGSKEALSNSTSFLSCVTRPESKCGSEIEVPIKSTRPTLEPFTKVVREESNKKYLKLDDYATSPESLFVLVKRCTYGNLWWLIIHNSPKFMSKLHVYDRYMWYVLEGIVYDMSKKVHDDYIHVLFNTYLNSNMINSQNRSSSSYLNTITKCHFPFSFNLASLTLSVKMCMSQMMK